MCWRSLRKPCAIIVKTGFSFSLILLDHPHDISPRFLPVTSVVLLNHTRTLFLQPQWETQQQFNCTIQMLRDQPPNWHFSSEFCCHKWANFIVPTLITMWEVAKYRLSHRAYVIMCSYITCSFFSDVILSINLGLMTWIHEWVCGQERVIYTHTYTTHEVHVQ